MTTREALEAPGWRAIKSRAMAVWMAALAAVAVSDAPAQSAVRIDDVRAVRATTGVTVFWINEPEAPAIACVVERLDKATGVFRPIHQGVLPASADGTGEGRADDPGAPSGAPVLTYRIAAVDARGRWQTHGPFDVVPASAAAPVRAAAAVPAPALLPASTSQPGYWVKIPISVSGLYYLDSERIADNLLGMDQATVEGLIAATNLALSCQGHGVPWFAAPLSTGIFFYAASTNNRYAAGNVYRLQPGAGTPMAVQTGAPPAAASPGQWYMESLRWERDLLALVAIFEDAEDDYWLWQAFALVTTNPVSANFTFAVNGVSGVLSTSTPARATVRLKGASLFPPNPEHMAIVSVNGKAVATNTWDGFARGQVEGAFTNLLEGSNTLTVKSVRAPGVAVSDYPAFVLDGFDIAFPRLLKAQTNALSFTPGTNSEATVSGFSTPDVRVLDVTDPFAPILRADVLVDADTNGEYRATFAPSSTGHTYLAVASPAVLQPASARGRMPADLESATNRADYIAIAGPGFEATAASLVEHRRGQGLDARLVAIEDVYDRFSCGMATPWAIRTFITHALGYWADAPEYVVLAGAGSYDYKQYNYKGTNTCPVPPVMTYVPSYGLRATDAPLADTDGDGAPNVAIGRLHCQTTQEMAGVIAKIKSFEQGSAWRSSMRLSAGLYDPDAGDFSASSDMIAARIPSGYVVDRNYNDTQTIAQVASRLKAGIKAGAHLVSYFGHGGPDVLAATSSGGTSARYIYKTDLPSFTNRYQAPIMCAMTCDFAYFGAPNSEKLGEGMVARAAGGFSGLLGCVAPTYNYASEIMADRLYAHIFEGHAVRFGDALVLAMADYRQTGTLPYVLNVMSFLGDPATVIAPPGELYAYEIWRRAVFTPAQQADEGISGPAANPDGDEHPNLLEFAFNRSPTNAADWTPLVPFVETAVDGFGVTNQFGGLRYPRRKWVEGLETRIEVSYDLPTGEWLTGPLVCPEVDVVGLDSVMEEVTVQLQPALSPWAGVFARLRVWLAP